MIGILSHLFALQVPPLLLFEWCQLSRKGAVDTVACGGGEATAGILADSLCSILHAHRPHTGTRSPSHSLP